jgi:hypothetical protein
VIWKNEQGVSKTFNISGIRTSEMFSFVIIIIIIVVVIVVWQNNIKLRVKNNGSDDEETMIFKLVLGSLMTFYSVCA